jgi:hypothetical protein
MSTETSEIDLDAAWSIEDTAIDNQAADNAEKALLDEPGYYVSHDGMTVDPEITDDGRKQYVIKGLATNEKGKRTRIFTRISPDYRPKRDRDGMVLEPEKADWRYEMWLKARRAYITAVGEPPSTFRNVTDYLRSQPVRYLIRQMNGNGSRGPSTMVVNIAAS